MVLKCDRLFPFPEPLVEARLLRRYKRFLADVELGDGSLVTAHCPNPGRMTSIIPQAEEILLSDLGPPGPSGRKLRYRWELARVGEHWVAVNTQLANKVAERLLERGGSLRERLGIGQAAQLKREVKVGNCRFDFAYQDEVYIEVKQVSLRAADAQGVRWAAFPDAVTARGRRHLEQLTQLRAQGIRTVLLYIVGREDVDRVRPAWEVDPDYSKACQAAADQGVELHAAQLEVREEGLNLAGWLPLSTAAL